jgi:CHAD domain-containing protein
MAKARDIPRLHAAMPFAQAAAATVAVRAEELFEQSENVLDMQDIERVHDMRVASRRLRAVLEIYAVCFPPDAFKPLLKEVKALADALGERRDPDVLLDRLAAVEAELPRTDARGIEAFAAPVHEEQRRGNELLAQALAEAERTDLRGRLAALAASAVEPELPEPEEPEAPAETEATAAAPGETPEGTPPAALAAVEQERPPATGEAAA